MRRYAVVLGSLALIGCGSGSSVSIEKPPQTAPTTQDDTSLTVASHRSDENRTSPQRDFSSDPRLGAQRTLCAVQVGDRSSERLSVGAAMAEPVLIPCVAARD